MGGQVLPREPQQHRGDGHPGQQDRHQSHRAGRRLVREARERHVQPGRLGGGLGQVPSGHQGAGGGCQCGRVQVRHLVRARDGVGGLDAVYLPPRLVPARAGEASAAGQEPDGTGPVSRSGSGLLVPLTRGHPGHRQRRVREVGHEPAADRGVLRRPGHGGRVASRGQPPVRAGRVPADGQGDDGVPPYPAGELRVWRRALRSRHAVLQPADLVLGQHGRPDPHEDPVRHVARLPRAQHRRTRVHCPQPHHGQHHPTAHARLRGDVRHLRLRARHLHCLCQGSHGVGGADQPVQGAVAHHPLGRPLQTLGPVQGEPRVVDVRVARQEPSGGVRVLDEQRPLEQPSASAAAAGAAA
mmetsp:Transcript_3001/g.6957  ORF Transcript_3001/g.6957 Transcript_3001/m.6957 type:complete len:355 (+) Transcript_3001:634-1698(+)